MNRRTFLSLSAVSLFLGPAYGCGKKKYQMQSPVELLEDSIKTREQHIKDLKAIQKAELEDAKKRKDYERVKNLIEANEGQIRNEENMLEMEKKELEKERKKAGK